MPVAIIAGTAIYNIPGKTLKAETIETPYGSALIYRVEGNAEDLIFLARHGITHDTPPHKINYRANIKALEMMGVKRVLATNAVGSINKEIPPLGLALLTDFLDFTSGRKHTFFDGGDSGVKHVDVSIPYCPVLNKQLLALAPTFDIKLHPEAVYVCTNGPRLESPAEIRMYARMGGDVIGMTGIPEATLARELGLCYSAVAFSVNWAAGIEKTIRFVGNSKGFDKIKTNILGLFIETLKTTSDADCFDL
ncbi:MAG: S-methyl-5'-thioinosine phosphorylase [Deltaproteobacteria bacterium]|nr:S-methyl-5'-thioinosine phosphorylase [Deltaproteobacteria bacterium]